MDKVKSAEKLKKMQEWLRQQGSALVAYSGGIDSTFLLKSTVDAIGVENALGVTARAESLTDEAFQAACDLAQKQGFRHETIEYSELEIENYAHNPINRCYYCKHELFSRLKELAGQRGLAVVLEGSNFDDVGDHRPGMQAAAELEIHAPLKMFELTKEEIRALAKEQGLPNWDLPSQACLSSRFPYGTTITREGLEQVGAAEGYIRKLGFNQVRVRWLGDLAKIELPPEDLGRLFEGDVRERIVAQLKEIGFTYIAVDLQGYRTGALNEALMSK